MTTVSLKSSSPRLFFFALVLLFPSNAPATSTSCPHYAALKKQCPPFSKQGKQCAQLHTKKNYLCSAFCFEGLALHLGPTKKLGPLKRLQKGKWLRKAAEELDRAATKQKKPAVAAFLRAQALRWLDLYRREKLCEPYTCRTSIALQSEILGRIGYASLVITTGHKQAKISIKGYCFQQKATGNWTDNVHPGPYKVTVTYPDSPPQQKNKTVHSHKNTFLTFQPPVSPRPGGGDSPPSSRLASRRRLPPRRPPSPPAARPLPLFAWIGYIGGGVLLVGGGVLAGTGGAQWATAYETKHDDLTPTSQFPELDRQIEGGQLLTGIGGALAGAGLALVIAGAITHALATPPKKTSNAVHPDHRHKEPK